MIPKSFTDTSILVTGHAPKSNRARPGEPEQVGHFLLCSELGQGGMATVYLAIDERPESLHRVVAFKRIHRQLANVRPLIERFLAEARVMSLIRHPNVCPLYDYGGADGSFFMVMALLIGESLAQIQRRRYQQGTLLPLPIVLRILTDVSAGLSAIHQTQGPNGKMLGIVHRDVSPQNVILSEDGGTRILDFGIAMTRGPEFPQESGRVLGKVGYTAPELLTEDTIDTRADLWSLGVMAWEMLAGTRLFRSAREDTTADLVISADIPPIDTLRVETPDLVVEAVQAALQRDPAHRATRACDLEAAFSTYAASAAEVQAWFVQEAQTELARRRRQIQEALDWFRSRTP